MKRTLGLFRLGAIIGAVSLLAPHGRAETTLTTLVTFDRTNGCIPQSGLTLGKDGNFYGTLSYGGWYDLGTLFRMAPDGKCIILVTFDGDNGSHPDSLIQGKDGNFHGTTLQGGPSGSGSVFKMTPDGTITTLASFTDYFQGFGPGGLVQGQDGNLYGSTSEGASGGKGSTFKVALNGELTTPASNGLPAVTGGLLKAKDGNSYGTTFADRGDGTSQFGVGTVFEISPDGVRTNLIIFNQTNGANPLLDLVQGRDGNIYGITTRGGAFNQGTIFRLNLTGTSSSTEGDQRINVPVLIHPISNKFDSSILDSMDHSIKSYGKIIAEGSNSISGVNKAFAFALEYVWEAQTGHRPTKPPSGVTLTEISNAYNMVLLWSTTVSPRPIKFYGKVVDENGQPVEGAIVHLGLDGGATNRNPRPFTDTGKKSADIASDSAGLFSLTNAVGTELDVSVSKDGYYASNRNRAEQNFKYSKMNFELLHGINDTFKPDSNHPVIYYLHKKRQGVELITSGNGMRPDVWVRVPKENTPVRVDIFQKQASTTGQLEISQTKPPWQTATNWSFNLRISDGGLIENQDEFQFEAPETGYQPTVEYDFTKGETNWTTHAVKQFYIVFGQPRQYGWMRFESDITQETVFVTYAINPTGSRNLEPAN